MIRDGLRSGKTNRRVHTEECYGVTGITGTAAEVNTVKNLFGVCYIYCSSPPAHPRSAIRQRLPNAWFTR